MQDDVYGAIRRALFSDDKKIYIIKAQVGAGKSHSYLKLMEQYKECRFIIAVPTNLLKREIYEKAKAMGIKIKVTPSLEEIKDEIPDRMWEHIQKLYKMGMHHSVHKYIRKELEQYGGCGALFCGVDEMPEPKEESRMKSPVCKRILYVIGGLLLLFLITGGVIWRFYPLLLPSLEVKQSEAATELFAMDTYISMTAYGPDAEETLTEASNEIRKIEQLLSVTNPDSDIHAVNHSGGQPVMVSRETAKIVSFALHMAEETNGALGPQSIPF